LVVAADGGALTALRWGRTPDVVVGDLDSIGEAGEVQLERRRAAVERFAREKDQTDTELALLTAKRRGATSIEVLGALGGARLDHALANVYLLAHPALRTIPVALCDERHEVRLLRGPGRVTIDGKVGDVVTLLPISSMVSGITTSCVRYALRDGSLRLGSSRGVSNEVTGTRASVRAERGSLLVVVHSV
jgi:thiamine pyrophosphokinase